MYSYRFLRIRISKRVNVRCATRICRSIFANSSIWNQPLQNEIKSTNEIHLHTSSNFFNLEASLRYSTLVRNREARSIFIQLSEEQKKNQICIFDFPDKYWRVFAYKISKRLLITDQYQNKWPFLLRNLFMCIIDVVMINVQMFDTLCSLYRRIETSVE